MVNQAKDHDANDYTEESYGSLQTAITNAEQVLANDEVEQSVVDSTVDALQNAINGLEEKSEPEGEGDNEEEEEEGEE